MCRRFFTMAAAVAATVVLTAAPALSHECYIASRSWQGNLMAGTNSQAWFQVDLNQEFNNDPTLSDADRQCQITQLTAHGVPLVFTITSRAPLDRTGSWRTTNPNSWLITNGKGVDHFFDVYGPAIGASFATCGCRSSPDQRHRRPRARRVRQESTVRARRSTATL
jgi:hypothetical protein